MSVEIAWKQNILVTDFHLLKSLLVGLGFGSQGFICGFSRQNICSVLPTSVLSHQTQAQFRRTCDGCGSRVASSHVKNYESL